MWVMEALQYIDLGRKVFFELFVKLRQVHGLDRYIGFRLLCDRNRLASIARHTEDKERLTVWTP
jgi:hypothetical protein